MSTGRPAPRFATGGVRSRWLVILLAVTAIINLVSVVSGYVQVDLISSSLAGRAVNLADARASDELQSNVALLQVAVWIPTMVFFLLWVRRAYRNMQALGVPNVRFSPGWAVGWFFVPVMNFFRPWQIVTEVWRRSKPLATDLPGLRSFDSFPLVSSWWVFFMLSGSLGRFGDRLMRLDEDQVTSMTVYSGWLLMAASAALMAASLLAVLMVRRIDFWQYRRYKEQVARQ